MWTGAGIGFYLRQTMSSISSTTNSGLYQFIQGLSSESTTSTAGETTAATGTTDASGSTAAGTTTATSGHHHHHGSGGGFGKIADAVTSALQSTTTDGSTDPNQAITNALTQLFQGTASDPTAAGTSATPTLDASSTGKPATGTPTSSVDSLQQTLAAHGVTEQQFQADLTAALKNAQQSGAVDTSAFPAGSFVDATA